VADLRSENVADLASNLAPLLGLAAAMDTVLKKIAAAYGYEPPKRDKISTKKLFKQASRQVLLKSDSVQSSLGDVVLVSRDKVKQLTFRQIHENALARTSDGFQKAKKQKVLRLPVAVGFFVVGVGLLVYGLFALATNEWKCSGLSGCTKAAHPLLDLSEDCACAVFQAPKCDNSTANELALSARKGYLQLILVGSRTGVFLPSESPSSSFLHLFFPILPLFFP
jgi:hypothetical protein